MSNPNIVVNNQIVDTIKFVDVTNDNEVLGILKHDGSQTCDNGYKFDLTYKKTVEKE